MTELWLIAEANLNFSNLSPPGTDRSTHLAYSLLGKRGWHDDDDYDDDDDDDDDEGEGSTTVEFGFRLAARLYWAAGVLWWDNAINLFSMIDTEST
ncbi:hypothetical protein RRG08_024862 [Elysia crispata]|uniref:Uncharacterized protein n=1 Tax=Elysia crispata TaxID=231223 RepID=A0AAE0YJD3_9GAST|nr:hypothetical protein RRG08_024862 [Elysia crispata]